MTRDGVPPEGKTAVDVVDALRAASRTPGPDRAEYIEIVAQGARLQTGALVRVIDCEAVLTDLEKAGLIEKLG